VEPVKKKRGGKNIGKGMKRNLTGVGSQKQGFWMKGGLVGRKRGAEIGDGWIERGMGVWRASGRRLRRALGKKGGRRERRRAGREEKVKTSIIVH